MQLVVLAAGHGRRFGGLKQLAPVGPNDEALMDYTARDALGAGFDRAVLIVREEVREELLDHNRRYWPPELEVAPVEQGPIAGTAQAVASAAPVLDGAFGVVNADDLYGAGPLRTLAANLRTLAVDEHLIVSYHLAETVLTDAPVTRGICQVDESGHLEEIVEHTVERQSDGSFVGRPIREPDREMAPIPESAVVSMNLWGFSPSILGELDAALAAFDPPPPPPGEKPPELLLPEVVGELVARRRARVRVVSVEGRCIGITHPDDLPLVRSLVAEMEGVFAGDGRSPESSSRPGADAGAGEGRLSR